MERSDSGKSRKCILPRNKKPNQRNVKESFQTSERKSILNQKGGSRAETLSKQARMDSSTIGKSLFRKKLQSRRTKSLTSNVEDDFNNGLYRSTNDMQLPAYERVVLKKPAFKRPVVFFGPLADIARQLLLANFAPYFSSVEDESVIRIPAVNRVIEADKHCVLNISPCSVERLQAAQYAPIAILIDVDSRNRIRELRSKAGATTVSARRLMEQTVKLKKHYSHLLTATLDALKEDGWFDALRMLIAHLQERRVWIPETAHYAAEDVVLFPMQPPNESTDENSRSEYAVYDNPMESPRNPSSLTSTPQSTKSGTSNLVVLPDNTREGVYDADQNGFESNSNYSNGMSFIDEQGTSATDKANEVESTVIENVYAVIDWNGGTVTCPESGVELILPTMAIPVGKKQEMFVKVCEDANRKGEALLSPVVMCGPQGLRFNRPIELRLPHRATRDANNPSNVFDGFNQFVLKTGSGNTWRNIELLEPPVQNTQNNYISVFIDHF